MATHRASDERRRRGVAKLGLRCRSLDESSSKKNSNWVYQACEKRVCRRNYLPAFAAGLFAAPAPLKLRRCQIQVAEAFFYTLQHDVAGDTTIFGST